jgi:spore maturation protein CgeB
MKFACFYHSLISDWNHGNAHFLRGMMRELRARGHQVCVFEPTDAWSVENLRRDHGDVAIAAFHAAYPELCSRRYDPGSLDLDEALDGVDVVIVHEWSDPELVARIGRHRSTGRRYSLLFHDTHHRMVSAPDEMARYDLTNYDGVLAFGNVIRDLYRERGLAQRAWTWHEAADIRTFFPQPARECEGEVVWVGNWGEGERSSELREMLIDPIATLGLRAKVYGVRYPEDARRSLAVARIAYGGWLPTFEVPAVFGRYRATIHVPRRPYVQSLPGIPTIRPFEALACGIPLLTSPWHDTEHLFTPGDDFLVARNGSAMTRLLRAVIEDRALATTIATHGRETVLARHTCRHRADELFAILTELGNRRALEQTA